METRKLSLVFAISGFIYTTILFFIFLRLFGIYDLESIFQNIKDYLPYLSVLIFFLAFVIGIISESILQAIVFWCTKKSFDAEQVKIMVLKSEIARNSILISYNKLVILRHFVIGPFLLILVSIFWILGSDIVDKGKIILYIIVSAGSIVLLSSIAYSIHRNIHKKLLTEIQKLYI
jgi:hypothetical protein